MINDVEINFLSVDRIQTEMFFDEIFSDEVPFPPLSHIRRHCVVKERKKENEDILSKDISTNIHSR